ncbi:hypothetical protein BCR34DRAFT_595670 [Clohesyomyces aquaticus]|uniref:Ubiquitin-like protease family profile domain-containing protein n=1 Tax=Clohesyomyces aquaticus TaxID=1231657 RepID=A0A1Y2A9N4_9PLEO|nr:hypothetical protein BCR34DRAFT_595670 [Clohesyomyces aquaticus]
MALSGLLSSIFSSVQETSDSQPEGIPANDAAATHLDDRRSPSHVNTVLPAHRCSPSSAVISPLESVAIPPSKITSNHSRKRARVSEDELRLTGSFEIPKDATRIPDPRDHFGKNSSDMSVSRLTKPGAGKSFKPVDTINASTPFQARQHRTITYGSSRSPNTPGQYRFLEMQQEAHGGERPLSPGKRRKTHHLPNSHEAIILDGEDDGVPHRPSSRSHDPHTSPYFSGSVSSASHRSNESTQKSMRAANPRPQSEFKTVDNITNPQRKKSRHIHQPRRASQDSLASSAHLPAEKGAMASSPIALDDDDRTPKQKSPRQELLKQFQSVPRRDEDELQRPVQAMIFQPSIKGSNRASRINPSTSHKPRPERSFQDTGRDRTLRDTFRPVPTETISDDELQRSPTRAAQGRDKPSAILQRKSAQPKTAGPTWPLKYAATYDSEASAPGLVLRVKSEAKTFTISKSNQLLGSNTSLWTFGTEKIVGPCHADHQSRMRIMGSRDTSGNQFWYDLEFANTSDFKVFRDQYITPALPPPRKVTLIPRDDMITIFRKKPHRREEPTEAALPGMRQDEEIALLKARTRPREQRPGKRNLLIHKLASERDDGDGNYITHTRRGSRGKEQSNRSIEAPNRGAASSQLRAKRASRRSHADDSFDLEAESAKNVQPLKFSEEHGLGARWDKPVPYGTGRRRALVDFDDLFRLDETEFLNDSLIDFYMIYLFNQANIPPSKVYFFNTHFYTTLTRPVKGQRGSINYEAVARWTAKEDLFNYDYIAVPINEDIHWYLAIICNVPNIKRTPVLDESSRSSAPPPETMDNERSEQAISTVEATINGIDTPVRLPDEAPTERTGGETYPRDDDTTLFDEEQDGFLPVRNDVEEVVIGEGAQTPQKERKASEQSPVEETVRMKGLSITDPKTKDNNAESAAKKRGKRKSGPPAKKFDPNEPIILVLDSLGHTHPRAVRHLKDYIREEGDRKRGMEAVIEQNVFNVKDIPTQNNFYDCGVYVLGYLQKFFQDPDKFVRSILTREMKKEEDWPDMKPSTMRDNIRKILQDLARQQQQERKEARKAKKEVPPPMKVDPTGNTSDRPTLPPLLSPIELEALTKNTAEQPPAKDSDPVEARSSSLRAEYTQSPKKEPHTVKLEPHPPTVEAASRKNTESPDRRKRVSPQVVIPKGSEWHSARSPKRPHAEIVDNQGRASSAGRLDGADNSSPSQKKVKLDAFKPAISKPEQKRFASDAQDPHRRGKRPVSPELRHQPKAHHPSKNTKFHQEPARKSSSPHGHSHHDPIEIDDSQQSAAKREPMDDPPSVVVKQSMKSPHAARTSQSRVRPTQAMDLFPGLELESQVDQVNLQLTGEAKRSGPQERERDMRASSPIKSRDGDCNDPILKPGSGHGRPIHVLDEDDDTAIPESPVDMREAAPAGDSQHGEPLPL